MKFANIFKESEETVEKALLSLWTLGSHPMRDSIIEMFRNEPLMAEPVFQSTYGWETTDDNSWRDYFLPEVINNLGIGANYPPYTHQASSWKTLLDENETNSIVVTSGTGSGKTECFLYPVMNDIVREVQADVAKGEDPNSVRAIFLYPLNALMADQCKRIKGMCDSFDGVKFAIYNGNTPEHSLPNGTTGSQLQSRDDIRNTPPQILLSNPSMLEYILVRGKDQTFINRSRGKLRWIVIDEAHSYSGSAAVELKHQISRILDAFGMDISNVHFACTSATIGGDNGNIALRQFISELTGQNIQRIHVIGGSRAIPEISAEEVRNLLDENHLEFSVANILKVRDQINNCSGMSLKDIWSVIHGSVEGFDMLSALEEIDKLCELNDLRNNPLLSLRAHFHMRTINGLYTCVNPNCHCNADGAQYRHLTSIAGTTCKNCNSPLLEVIQCKECGQFLISGEYNLNNNLVKQEVEQMDVTLGLRVTANDGNTTQAAPVADCWTTFKLAPYEQGYIQPVDNAHASRFDFGLNNNQELVLIPNTNGNYILLEGDHRSLKCPCCGESENSFEHFRVPVDNLNRLVGRTLLKETAPHNREWGKYIAFTDSRQGTAIGAKNFNIESEKIAAGSSLIRTLTQRRLGYHTTPQYIQAEQMYNVLIALPEERMDDQIRQAIQNMRNIMLQDIVPINMREVANSIIDGNLFNHLKSSDDHQEAYKAAVTRTYLGRRPLRKPSLESLGLIEIVYDGVNKLKAPAVLTGCHKADGSAFTDQDWRNFIKIALDFVIRMGNHIQPLVPNERQYVREGSYGLPINGLASINRSTAGNISVIQNRLVLLLCAAMGIDTLDQLNANAAEINSILNEAWTQLTDPINNLLCKVLQNGNGYDDQRYYGNQHLYVGYYYLDLSPDSQSCKVQFLKRAWQCPMTHRLVNTFFCGYSPAITGNVSRRNFDKYRVVTEAIEMPIPTSVDRNEIKEWIDNNETVRHLKDLGLWSDFHDQYFLSESACIAAEHSAQQSKEKLDEYTEKFINGSINVLNCSTTMEMGVDIGDIEIVLMDTVPPGAANYLQRAGRAGRMGQSKAVAFTLCNATPIGMKAFRNPMWALLDSNEMKMVQSSLVITQRHINSFFFRQYVNKNIDKFNAVTNLEDFFGTDENTVNYCSLFIAELQKYATDKQLRSKFQRVFGAQVAYAVNVTSQTMQDICDNYWKTMNSLLEEQQKVQQEINQQQAQGNNNLDSLKRKDIAIFSQIFRIRKENLLTYLTENQFLPNANMPTGIVEFDYCDQAISNKKRDLRRKLVDLKNRIDQERNGNNDQNTIRRLYNERREVSKALEKLINSTIVQRDVRTALNEYAPGQTVVINEKNYVSEGISYWTNLNNNRQRFLYHCENCGHTKYTAYQLNDCTCEVCNNHNYLSVYPKLANRNVHFTEAFEPVQFRTDSSKAASRTEATEKRFFDIRAELTGISWGHNQSLNNIEYASEEQGEIIYYNLGEGAGFAICPACGRATLDSWSDHVDLEKAHRTLDGGNCPGGNIKRHVAFTGRQQTCYTAMKFYVNGLPSRDKMLVLSLGVMLKRALVEYMHIDENEIDFGIKNERDAVVLFVYDVNKGGCGYSTHLGNKIELQRVLDIAYNMMIGFPCHCEDDNTGEGACSHCLIDRTTFRYRDLLSKRKAYEWLVAQKGNRIEIPDNVRTYSQDAQSMAEDLKAILNRAVNDGNVSEIGIGVSANSGINASDFVDLSTTVGKALNDAVHNGKIVRLYIEYNDDIDDFDTLYKLTNVQQMMPNYEIAPVRSLGDYPTLLLIRDNVGYKHYFTDESSDNLCMASEWIECTNRIFEDGNKPDFEPIALPNIASIRRILTRSGKLVMEGDVPDRTYNVTKIFSDAICQGVIRDANAINKMESILRDQTVTVNFSDAYVNSALAGIILPYMIKEIRDLFNCTIDNITLQLDSSRRNWDPYFNNYNPIYRSFEDGDACNDFLEDIFEDVLGTDYIEAINVKHHRWLKFTSPKGYVELRPDHGIDGGWYTRTRYCDIEYNNDYSNIRVSKASYGQADVVYYVIIKENS